MQGVASHEWVKGGPEEGRGEGDEAWDHGCLAALLPGCGLQETGLSPVREREGAQPGARTTGPPASIPHLLDEGDLKKDKETSNIHRTLHLNHY